MEIHNNDKIIIIITCKIFKLGHIIKLSEELIKKIADYEFTYMHTY